MVADADVIIVGAGHNGLAAAMHLAVHGKKVLVLERAPVAGGAAKSGEVTLPGFIHDLYATNLGLFLASPIYRRYGRDLEAAGFRVAVSPQPYASVFPDGTGLGVWTDSEKTRSALAAQSLRDAESWDGMVAYFQRTAPQFLPLLQVPWPSLAAARLGWRLIRRLGLVGAQELAQQLAKSPREFVQAWFESPKVRALFIPWAFHLDFGPDVSGGAMFPFVESVADYLHGMAVAKGGISRLIDAMVSFIRQHKGQVETGREVARVVIRKGRAVGVEMADGQTLVASQAVFANVTPTRLFGQLVPEDRVPPDFMQKVRRYRYGPGTAMMHLALDGPLPWAAGETFQRFLYVHVAPYVDDVARTYQEALAGLLPASPLLVIGQQSFVDPSRAPNGHHTLWVQVRAVPGQIRGDAAGKTGARAWEAVRDLMADRILDKIESYAPGTKERVKKATFFTPEDLERDNPNLVGGDSISGSHHPDQNYFLRPFPGWSRYRTPLPGLWMVGAGTWPGAGLNATSGYLAAEALLKSRH